MDLATVEATLHRLFIAADGTSLRREDLKKAREAAALLDQLARIVRPDRLLVDAAAGKAYVGLLAVELIGVTRVHVIEREPRRAALCRQAASRLSRAAEVTIVERDVADASAWPADPDVVVGLHACGAASDA
ncbi:MAG TPA: methyltransferase, partial [Polyangia bacterium]|nr:methyltransferase [Polyangia bacterium]